MSLFCLYLPVNQLVTKMSETIEVPQAQPKAVTSGLDRLSRDFDEIFPENTPSTKEPTPVATATEETAKLEGATIETPVATIPETTVKTEVEKPAETIPATIPETTLEKEVIGFEEPAVQQEESGWKPIIEAFGYQIPDDFAEEKGFEVLAQLKDAEFKTRLEEVKNFREAEIFTELPEDVRDEARLTFELFKSGQTLEQINAPIQQIKEWKSMSKEELIRHNLEGITGYTQEMINHRMEQIQEANHVDIEYQILINYVNQKEQELVQQRQQQIQTYSNQLSQVKEQKRQQDFNSFKTALDKVPTFMDRKLSDENKTSIINDYNNGYVNVLTQNPEKLARFMLYDRYGEIGLKYLQDRAIEKATIEKAKTQLNIPPVTGGGANTVEIATQSKNGIDRLASDPRYA